MDINRQVLPVHVPRIGGAKLTEAGSLGEASIGSRMHEHVAASASVYVLGIHSRSSQLLCSFLLQPSHSAGAPF